MRIAGASLLVALLFSTACNDSFPVPPNIPPTKSTVTVAATTNPATFALFRDGPGAQWAAMTAAGDGSYTATVTGPYLVAVGCSVNAGATQVAWEHGDVPDPTTKSTTNVTPACNDIPTFKVSGIATGATAGDTISLGVGTDQTVGAGGAFSFPAVPAGTYDVVVHNATQVKVGTSTVKVTNADLTAQTIALGSAITLTSVTMTSESIVTTNQGTDDAPRVETASDEILLAGPNSPQPIVIFSGTGASTKTTSSADIPSMVVAATDVPTGFTQQVTYTGTVADPTDATQQLTRTSNRNYTVGDSLDIILPAGYGSVVWYADPAGMSFIGDSDPADLVTETLVGLNTSTKAAVNTIELTNAYLSNTSIARIVLEVDQTGFLDAARVDIKQPYTRSTAGKARVDDDGTAPPTHDNRSWTSTQQEGIP